MKPPLFRKQCLHNKYPLMNIKKMSLNNYIMLKAPIINHIINQQMTDNQNPLNGMVIQGDVLHIH